MAVIAPSTGEGKQQLLPNEHSKDLIKALRPWRNRLWAQQLLHWTGNGLLAGLLLACLLLGIARLTPWAIALYWAFGASVICLLFAFWLALWSRPSIAKTARHVDKLLSLHDRVSTAWELRNQSSALFTLQQRDALTQLSKHSPARSISLWPHRSHLIAFGIIAIVLALLLLLPNPMTTILKQQAAFQASIAKQIAAIDHQRTSIDHQATTSPQQRQQIDQILRDLEAKLQQAKNETEAQQALAQAQAKLDQLRDPQAANKAQGRSMASSALQSSSNPNLSALGQALASSNSKNLAAALQNLASQVNKMSPVQRSKLAQQIEQVANSAAQNPNLSSALHQLAKSVANGSSGDISDAANAVETATAQDSANSANESSIDSASKSLQQAANNLASGTDTTTAQGQNQGQGQGQTPGQNQGQGQGQGQGQNQGQGQGQGSHGQGGSGGGNSSNKSGQNEQVYVPGQIGSGTSSQSNNGSNGLVQPGSPVPYSQVIAQYMQMAHDAIDNSDISPNLKDLVHGYFDTLEGQQ